MQKFHLLISFTQIMSNILKNNLYRKTITQFSLNSLITLKKIYKKSHNLSFFFLFEQNIIYEEKILTKSLKMKSCVTLLKYSIKTYLFKQKLILF